MRLVTDVFEFAAAELPRWNTISISGYHMREAGATAAQELAFTLADGIAYVDAALARGLDVDAFAGRLSFGATLVVLAEVLGATVVQRHPTGRRAGGRRRTGSPAGTACAGTTSRRCRAGSTPSRPATRTAT